ncbi:MAG: helix-turn-helix transcriptional regulator [Acidobacteriota bacterium]
MKKKKNFTPLTEATYLILLSLIEPLHGYGIMQKIESISEKRVKMGPGTLYGGLSGLLEKKMIQKLGESPRGEERKKMYKITDSGMDVLEKEYSRLKQLVSIGENVLEKEKNNG